MEPSVNQYSIFSPLYYPEEQISMIHRYSSNIEQYQWIFLSRHQIRSHFFLFWYS